MIVIEIHNRRYDVDARWVVEELGARIEVDGHDLRVVDGQPAWIDIKTIVLDHPSTGEDLTFESDPELWAATLPEAFRTGDTVVTTSVERSPARTMPEKVLVAAEKARGR